MALRYFKYLIVLFILLHSIVSVFSFDNKVREIIKPTQLIYPDTKHHQLLINETSLELLNSLLGQDLSILGVVGTFHSGKSFLLNQLMGTTDRFTVGPTVDPETKGIWMLVSKIEHQGKERTVLLLDTEGFYSSNVSETYDAKIFAITTLLSSHLIYNSVKIIDQSELEYLELLSRRTQLFSLKAQMKSNESDSNQEPHDFENLKSILKFPSLTWVVQDFFQDIGDQSATEWLHRLLGSRSRDESSSLSISEIFQQINCYTLFIPSGDKLVLRHLDRASLSDLNPTYLRELNTLKHELFNSLKPKLSGPSIGSLLRLLVDVANGNKFPSVPSIWSGFIKQQQQSAYEDSIIAYRNKMDKFKYVEPPFNSNAFLEIDRQASTYSKELYKQLLFGLEDAYKPGLPILHDSLKNIHEQFQRENNERIKYYLSTVHLGQFSEFSKSLDEISIPVSSKDLLSEIEKYKKNALLTYQILAKDYEKSSDFHSNYLSQLTNDLDRKTSHKQIQNKNQLETLLIKSVAASSDRFKSSLLNLKFPMSDESLKQSQKNFKQHAEDYFAKLTTVASGEAYYHAFLASLEKELSKIWDTIKAQNERIILDKAKSESDRCIYDFKKEVFSIILPTDETVLLKQLYQSQNQAIERFKLSLQEYHSSASYLDSKENLINQLYKQIELRVKENVHQTKLIVDEILMRVKSIVIAKKNDFFFRDNFIKFVQDECDKNLKYKIENQSLRQKVVLSFIENDLKYEVLSLWSYNPTNSLSIIFISLIFVLLFFKFLKN